MPLRFKSASKRTYTTSSAKDKHLDVSAGIADHAIVWHLQAASQMSNRFTFAMRPTVRIARADRYLRCA
jgi:hypothetical protein